MWNCKSPVIPVLLWAILLSGCASHSSSTANNGRGRDSQQNGQQPDLIPILAALHDQMHSWEGTPYQWGGTQLSGVDCSGFVWRTLKDRFNMPVGRLTTADLIHMGERVEPADLQPGDLVFFRINHEMHVGFYDTDQQFLHASSSRGVMRSSLASPYWKSVFLEARRLHKEYGAQISFNHDVGQTKLVNGN